MKTTQINKLFEACRLCLVNIRNGQSLYYDLLRDYLRELWDIRKSQEKPYPNIINQLQSIFSDETPPELSQRQFEALCWVFSELEHREINSELYTEITQRFIEEDLEIFKFIF